MNNKRGIAQAFFNPPTGVTLRRASVFDVFGISSVLMRSIRELCHGDHLGDPEKLGLWTANKDPALIRRWIESGAALWVATHGSEVAAVGGLRAEGEVSLLYVDPVHTRRGIGAALLKRLEEELRLQGCSHAHLHATKTANGFYCAQGWRDTGEPTDWHCIAQFPMRKSLHPSG